MVLRMRWVAFLALIAMVMTTANPAQARRRANKKKQWNKLVNQAQKQFQDEQYNESAETLIKAYDLKPVAKLLYNAARAYEKAGKQEQAARFYQRYIDADNTDAELLRNAASKLAELREAKARAELEQQQRIEDEKRKAEAERQRLEAERLRIIKEEKARKAEAERQRLLAEEEAKKGMVMPIVSYSLLGLGVTGLATGAVFGVLAMQDKGAWEASQDLDTRLAARDDAQFKGLGADIAYASGSLFSLIGAGLVAVQLIGQDDEDSKTEPAPDTAAPSKSAAAPQTGGAQ